MLAGAPNRMLQRFGAEYTLWRQSQGAGANPWDSGTITDQFFPCRAAERGPRAYIVKGTVQEQGRVIVLDPASLETTPRRGDRIAAGAHTANAPGVKWHQITEDPDAPAVSGTVACYRLKVSA